MKKFFSKRSCLAETLVLSFVFHILNTPVMAQDYSRFMNVKGWKIHDEIEKKGTTVNPPSFYDEGWAMSAVNDEIVEAYEEHKEVFDMGSKSYDPMVNTIVTLFLMADEMDYNLKRNTEMMNAAPSILVSDSKVVGDCVLKEREDMESWSGHGTIKYHFDEKSAGYIGGSKFYGLTVGKGESNLYRDESIFTIYPEDGTYEILLIPGNEEKTGMQVSTYADNTVWQDIMAGIQLAVGSQDTDAAAMQIQEVLEKNPPAREDAINALSDRYFIFSLEDMPLPNSGLIIEGETLQYDFRLKWKITPVN